MFNSGAQQITGYLRGGSIIRTGHLRNRQSSESQECGTMSLDPLGLWAWGGCREIPCALAPSGYRGLPGVPVSHHQNGPRDRTDIYKLYIPLLLDWYRMLIQASVQNRPTAPGPSLALRIIGGPSVRLDEDCLWCWRATQLLWAYRPAHLHFHIHFMGRCLPKGHSSVDARRQSAVSRSRNITTKQPINLVVGVSEILKRNQLTQGRPLSRSSDRQDEQKNALQVAHLLESAGCI